tara:strand:+ start:2164 stop:2496 length:333 start_codon:yes stop_codon:yes gene_type:complete
MSQSKVVLNVGSNGDASDLIDLAGTIIFGLSFDVAPVGSAPSGNLTVLAGDCATASDVAEGNAVCHFTMNSQTGGTFQIDFPAGLKLMNGLSVSITSNGHGDVSLTMDHA